MSKRLAQKHISQQTILEAAAALFAEQGYEGTSIRQIAVKAGISLGLLYNYFKGKEEVLQVIIGQGQQECHQLMALPEHCMGWEYLEHHIRATFKSMVELKVFWRLYYSLRLQSDVVKSLEKELQAEKQRVAQQLTLHLAMAGSMSPSAEAALLQATLEGVAQQYLLQENFPLQDVLIRCLVQLKNHLKAE